eukprot:1692933-Pyramimonas_sp.AAC.1
MIEEARGIADGPGRDDRAITERVGSDRADPSGLSRILTGPNGPGRADPKGSGRVGRAGH